MRTEPANKRIILATVLAVTFILCVDIGMVNTALSCAPEPRLWV